MIWSSLLVEISKAGIWKVASTFARVGKASGDPTAATSQNSTPIGSDLDPSPTRDGAIGEHEFTSSLSAGRNVFNNSIAKSRSPSAIMQ